MNLRKNRARRRFKTLTLRDVPPDLASLICDRAAEGHLSFSQALIALLHEQMAPTPPRKKRRDLGYLAGSWNEEESRAMEESLREQRKIDPKAWS
jgi:hypothetical protein